MISVCMATYNGERFIGEQLRSILEQLSPEDELIISDDGSTDGTVRQIETMEDSRICLIRNPNCSGVCSNFENALGQVTGDIIFLSDQDDIWEKNKVRVMTEYLMAYDLVVSDCSIVDREGHKIHESNFGLRPPGKGLVRNLLKNSYMGCCMAFKRDLLERFLPFPKQIPMHDWWMGLVAEACGQTFFCPERLVRYRRHSANQTPLAGGSSFSLMEKLLFRMNLCLALFKHLQTHGG